ncbi:MAG TPA: hypothetical protein VGP93_15920 [Polyangiaceae bacterium]|nr:hypothetical protein [Polyangiaceae bacterium]
MRRRYVGVSFEPFTGRYRAILSVRSKLLGLGRYDTERAAAIAHDRTVLYLGLERTLNLPRESRRLGPLSPEEILIECRQTWKVQRGGASRYRGVFKPPNSPRWAATLGVRYASLSVGGFKHEEDAAVAYDRMVLHYFGGKRPRNFPGRALTPASVTKLRAELGPIQRRPRRSKNEWPVGVFCNPSLTERAWAATITVRRRTLYLGAWPTTKAAALARDRAALHYLGREHEYFNSPSKISALEPADAATLAAEAFQLMKQTTTSRFRGVYFQRGAWNAHVSIGSRTRYLGRFASEEEAALTHDKAAYRARGDRAKLNFHPQTGELLGGKSLQQFEKARLEERRKGSAEAGVTKQISKRAKTPR